MKIALIGRGSMGSQVEALAVAKGHAVTVVVTEHHDSLPAAQLSETLRMAEVAIDFSVAGAVKRNVEACVHAVVPLVEGTTGWNAEKELVEKLVADGDGTMVFGANFSIGVNLFYRIAGFAAELFTKFPEYEAFIEEQHHSRKKDSPSGTALKIKQVLSKHVNVGDIAATRAGSIPGTHRVGFDGPADQVLLEHLARSREGFAIGALMAAEWIIGKKGIYEFSDVMDEICRGSE
jgi:4-hydroxy-tetrahydrodipicolinate reductase